MNHGTLKTALMTALVVAIIFRVTPIRSVVAGY